MCHLFLSLDHVPIHKEAATTWVKQRDRVSKEKERDLPTDVLLFIFLYPDRFCSLSFFYSSAFHLICMQNTCCITFLLMYMTKLHKCDESEYVDCIHAYSKTFHYDTQEEGGQPNTGLPQSYLYLYLLLLCFHAFVLYFHVLFSLYSISWAITAFWFDCCASPPRARFIRLALVFVFITRLTIYVTVCCSNSSVKSSATVFCCVLAGGRADDKK